MKCANCPKDGLYVYKITAKTEVIYCDKHLPSFLENAKKAGLLQKTEALKSILEEGLKTIGTPVVEAPAVVEEPDLGMNRAIHGSTMKATAPEVEEVTKPKKKAAKKKAE